MKIARLDHIVFTVESIPETAAFYQRVLGMRIETFGDGRTALHFGNQKINLHDVGSEVKPNAPSAAPGTADVCFVAETPLDEVIAELNAGGIEIELGPIDQSGALGAMRSVYFRDPSGNLIELSNYQGTPESGE